MASSVLENFGFTNYIDGIDESLFTSFSDELQDEGCSDERLHSIMQSLEAEINQRTELDSHDYDYDIDIEMFSNNGQMHHVEDGHGWHLKKFVLDCGELELAPCPLEEDMDFYMGTQMDEMADFTELGNLSEYLIVYDDVLIEGQGCGSLWQ